MEDPLDTEDDTVRAPQTDGDTNVRVSGCSEGSLCGYGRSQVRNMKYGRSRTCD